MSTTTEQRRRRRRRAGSAVIGACVLIALLGTGAGATAAGRSTAALHTFYVSPRGSDAGPGSQKRPFASIQRGVDRARAGDTVVVADGVYTAPSNPNRCGASAVVCIEHGGSSGAPLTIRSARRWGAKLDGKGTIADGFEFGEGADHVRIVGFDIANIANADGSSSGIDLYDGGSGSELVGNHIHDVGRVCTDTENGQVGIFVEREDVLITRNSIHDVGRLKPGENGCSYDSGYEGWENHDHGIYIDGKSGRARNIKIRSNIFYNMQHGWAIQLFPGTIDNLSVVNNTFAYGNPHRDNSYIVIDLDRLSNARFLNNVFFGPGGGSAMEIEGDSGFTGVTMAGNMTNGRALTSETASGIDLSSNVTRVDPRFVRGASQPYDFHLLASSPARNRGVSAPDARTDFDGRARPQESVLDRGALEYVKPK